ncbi:MAG: helix-turn-helix domain-containing protein [Candidatus Daviesbacteria bacterium]|nr:helix-turn-helix domain-containing protein [Candidatus Daviesbacteria bacterium]
MSKILLREQAIKLRIQGYTYGQIKRELDLAKSTLSEWLRKLPLNREQLELLSKNRERSKDLAIEKYIATRKKQRLVRLEQVLNQQNDSLLPMSEKELFLCGLFLYWGEGEKRHGIISISNTDPRVIKFALYWMTNSLKILREKIRINLHLYKDMSIDESTNFWSNILDIPKIQFNKPYIKKTNREGLTYKSFGHGTCKLYAGSVLLSEKIAMSIKAISDKYGAKSELFWYN